MCCRFYIPGYDMEEYDEILKGVRNPYFIKTSGDISPNDTVAVIANNKNNKPAAFGMRWGYTAYGKLIFNTRSETAGTKEIFRDGFYNRRCLIPALYYYEWDKDKNKFRISTGEKELIYLAGIYRFEEKTPVFSVLTREPTEELRAIHDRMPVILPRIMQDAWLDRTNAPAGLIHDSANKFEISQLSADQSLSPSASLNTAGNLYLG